MPVCNLLLNVLLQIACPGLGSHILGLLTERELSAITMLDRPLFTYYHMFPWPLLYSLWKVPPTRSSRPLLSLFFVPVNESRDSSFLLNLCVFFLINSFLYLNAFLPSGNSKSTFISNSGTTGRRKCGWLGIRLSFCWQWG